MQDVDGLFSAGHGVVSRRQLQAVGLDRAAIARLSRRRNLTIPRTGWLSTDDPNPLVLSAVRAGGALTCIDALHVAGAWHPPGYVGTHVRADRRRSLPHGFRRHYLSGLSVTTTSIDPPIIALGCAIRCLRPADAVAVADSALRRGIITADGLNDALRLGGSYSNAVRNAIDPSAESGIESLMRMILRRARVRFQAQVVIVGVGRVDFLVGDRLVIEVDGLGFHTGTAVVNDRKRDLALSRLGFSVLRFTYDDVVNRADDVLEAIRVCVRRREHVWTKTNKTWERDGLPNPVVPVPRAN